MNSSAALPELQVLIIGDSHAQAYDGLTFATESRLYRFRSVNTADRARGCHIVDAAGMHLDPEFEEALDAAGVFRCYGRPAAGVCLVLSLGGSDAATLALDPTWQTHDFLVPDFPLCGDRMRRCLSSSLARDVVRSWAKGLGQAVHLLRGDGIWIHGLLPAPPAHASDEQFRATLRSYGLSATAASATVRTKLAWLFRREIEALAAGTGVPWTDTWQVLAQDAFLRADYEFDGIHVNRAGAIATLPAICAMVAQSGENFGRGTASNAADEVIGPPQIIQRIEQAGPRIRRLLRRRCGRIVVYGIGQHTELLFRTLGEEIEAATRAYLVTARSTDGSRQYRGKPVLEVDSADLAGDDIVLLSSHCYEGAMVASLERARFMGKVVSFWT